MDRSEVISGVAEDLFAAEKSIDAALVQATSMIQKMVAGRAELGLSAVTFTESQSKVLATVAALSEARAAVVEAHHELAKDHRRMGWGVFAAGPGGQKEETRTQGALRVVESERLAS